MQFAFWLMLLGGLLVVCGTVWYSLRKLKERRLAEEERLASFMAATAGRPKMVEAAPEPVSGDGVLPQKLLFEAAHKAAEAGEPALAIQLYARLLARYPQTGFADHVRAAVEAQKKKLGKA
jgi:hypothetical protein